MTDTSSYREQLQRDTQFLCSDERMDTELVDRLVLQLNRIYPQILSDKEAHRVAADYKWHQQKRSTCTKLVQVCVCVQSFNSACVCLQFRNLSVSTEVRLAELLKHLRGAGEEACHEFYRGLHIQAEDIYSSLPSRVRERELADWKWTNNVTAHPERHVLNDRGPVFFLSCLCFFVGVAMLYYYREGDALRRYGPFLHCSAARLSKGAKGVFIFYTEAGK